LGIEEVAMLGAQVLLSAVVGGDWRRVFGQFRFDWTSTGLLCLVQGVYSRV